MSWWFVESALAGWAPNEHATIAREAVAKRLRNLLAIRCSGVKRRTGKRVVEVKKFHS